MRIPDSHTEILTSRVITTRKRLPERQLDHEDRVFMLGLEIKLSKDSP